MSRYEEYYAKLILEQYFPEKYKNLLARDQPDLWDLDNNVGIEVTSCVPEEERRAISIACEIRDSDNETKKAELIDKLEKGYRYSEYGLEHPMKILQCSGSEHCNIKETWCNAFLLSVDKKIKKLNSGNYYEMSEYNLYVYSELLIEDWMPEKLMKEIDCLNCKDKKFSYIYLVALGYLYVFDLPQHKCKKYDLDERIYGLGDKALKLAEGGEENE